MAEIQLLRIGKIGEDVLDFLALAVADSLGMHCSTLEPVIDPAGAFSPHRQQYNSLDILLEVSRLKTKPDVKVLGLTSVDLFIPILTFVFGQAQLNNRNAVMSTHRLSQTFYGLPEDEEIFYRRCEKEALHELGHTFGLVHCPRFDCIMYLSNSVEQVDLKSTLFCAECEAQLRNNECRMTNVE